MKGNSSEKYAVIILLQEEYKNYEILDLMKIPKWKLYQYRKKWKDALKLLMDKKAENEQRTT